MWTNPAFWTGLAGVIGAVAALVTAVRAHTRASDAHAIALGHALDRSWHPGAPRPLRRPPADLPPPSSPAAPSSG
jgi:hypothetical protein